MAKQLNMQAPSIATFAALVGVTWSDVKGEQTAFAPHLLLPEGAHPGGIAHDFCPRHVSFLLL